MNETYFRLEGKDELISQLQGIGLDVESSVEDVLKNVGKEAQAALRAQVQDGNGFSSEPGEAPNSQSGTLRSSIYAKLEPKHLGKEILLTVGFATKAFYAFMLEYGTKKHRTRFVKKGTNFAGNREYKYDRLQDVQTNEARVLPRPWFWDTLEAFWAKAPIKVEIAIEKVLSKYAKQYNYDPYTGAKIDKFEQQYDFKPFGKE